MALLSAGVQQATPPRQIHAQLQFCNAFRHIFTLLRNDNNTQEPRVERHRMQFNPMAIKIPQLPIYKPRNIQQHNVVNTHQQQSPYVTPYQNFHTNRIKQQSSRHSDPLQWNMNLIYDAKGHKIGINKLITMPKTKKYMVARTG